MTRIERILKNARMVLADKDAERWTDEDLLSILDEGHKDLCQHSRILKAQADVRLTFGSPYFLLPADCWQLTRATFENVVLPFATHSELDNAPTSRFTRRTLAYPAVDWQTEVGAPEAIVYDRRNVTEGMVYPIPDRSSAESVEFSSPFGITVESDTAVAVPTFGVVSEATDLTDPFGALADAYTYPALRCYYLQIPADIDNVANELATPYMFDTALKYYVVGNAFLLDIAEEYQAKGLQQLGFYNRELELANKSSARDHQRAAASRTQYRTGF